jgi:pimeloyl-ACP methyl ester carboxylesterase
VALTGLAPAAPVSRTSPYPAQYADVASPDGGTLRMAWYEAGPPDGPVALLLHGEPSWSYLYRAVMPVLVPTTPDDAASAANRLAWAALQRWEKPFLTAFSDGDPITADMAPVLQRAIPAARGLEHPVIAHAAHFLQEDAGTALGGPSSRPWTLEIGVARDERVGMTMQQGTGHDNGSSR